MFVNMLFNKEDRILINFCICLENTLHRNYWKNFRVRIGTSQVFRSEDTSLVGRRLGSVRPWTAYCGECDLVGDLMFIQEDASQNISHTHTFHFHFNGHFSRWTWVSRLPLNSPSPFIPGLRILLGQSYTFHIILNTIPPGLFLCLIPSTSHIIQLLTQSLSSFRSACPNHRNLLYLIIKLVPILRVLWVLHFSSFHSA